MGSTYLDDFVLNFDLNQLPNEGNIQTVEQKYDKLRKNICWLKSKIIGTQYLLVKYDSKKDEHEESLKAHAATREELKQLCINYKDASDKCVMLESEKKMMLANLETFKERLIDTDNKYSALISHTNQLQMLVKQLETEKDALMVEKELDKCNYKGRTERIILIQKEKDALQKEKDAILLDLIALKDVVLGKKKTRRSHINLLKKYVKDIKYKDASMCRSDISDDDLDSHDNFSTLNRRNKKKIHKLAKKDIPSVEETFIDNCSDSSNGEVSVDTGRGSSRANSHDKYLSSPDYVFTAETTKTPFKNPTQIEVASSPIIVFPLRSVATSPVIFDSAVPLFDDQYENYTDCFDSPEHSMENIPLSEDLEVIQQQDKFVDVCTSPIPDIRKFVDKGTDPMKNDELPLKSSCKKKERNENLLSLDNQNQKCFCQKGRDKKKVIDTCTSPIPEPIVIHRLIEIGTNTVNDVDSGNFDDCGKLKNQRPIYCDKSTCTENVELPENKLVDSCTSPIPKSDASVGKDRNIKNKVNFENSSSKDCKKCNCSDNIMIKKKFVDVGTSTTALEQGELVDIDVNAKLRTLKEKPSSRDIDDEIILPPKEGLRTREKVCLEKNSSKSMSFEHTNDSEVQHILNVMKLHHDVVSPISKTPSESHYLTLLPEMNLKLTKIWAAITNICKTPGHGNSNSLHHTHHEIEEIVESISGDSNITNEYRKGTSEGETPLEKSNMECVEDSDVIQSKEDTHTHSELSHENEIVQINKKAELQRVSPIQSVESFQDDIIIINATNTGKTNVCDVNEDYAEVVKTKRSLNIKKKSKLEKLRKKLLPTCKIKKMDAPVTKHPSKTSNFIPKETNSSCLNQKLAYEKAVKVMAELRSNQKNKTKLLTPPVSEGSCLNNTEPTISEPFEIRTRNRTRNEKLSKEKDTSTTISPKDLPEKSPSNRKVRKRAADTEIASLQGHCKRVLRSSNVSQIITETKMPRPQSIEAAESLNCGRKTKKNEYTNILNELSNLTNSPHGDKVNLKISNGTNINSKLIKTHNNLVTPIESGVIIEKDVRIMKPVVDLSECLTDNINAVAIVPGNAGFLDVKTNVNGGTTEEGFVGTVNIDSNFNNHETHCNKTDQGDHTKDLMETEDTNSEKLTKGCVSVENNIFGKEVVVPIGSATQTENTSSDTERANSYDDNCHNNSNINTEQNVHYVSKDVENLKQNNSKSLEVRLGDDAKKLMKNNPVVELIPLNRNVISNCVSNIINYSDLELYTVTNNVEDKMSPKSRRKENILCAAIDRYGVISVKYAAKKVPDTITNNINQRIEESMANIIASTKDEQKTKMDQLVVSIENYKPKYILSGLMKYLKDPTRKNELFNTVINGAAPPMTKPEMILLYVIEKLNASLPSGFINRVWNNIEHALFQLNRAPEFGVIESMSHFYAVLCRYFRNKSRLRCFMLDAMYCLQFKAVPLIRQCLEVCPGVLPYAHEHMAKTSLVTCLVYLLHFYKCQDRFNRAQDIRNILYRKYSYRFSEWNETMILEIFRKAIMDLKGIHNDKKMLRVALIILCKRHGAKWCQLNIVQNMLLPIIEKKDVPERIKEFCVLMLGPLLKPFPADRKAQCEIVINQLLQMLKQENSEVMTEAIYSSLIFMNKHDQERVVQALLHWNPEKVSPEFEEILNDYVMDKPLAIWKKLVTRKPSQCT